MLYQEALNVSEVSGVFRLMKYIMKFAAIIQLLGAFLLSFQFVPTFGWKRVVLVSSMPFRHFVMLALIC